MFDIHEGNSLVLARLARKSRRFMPSVNVAFAVAELHFNNFVMCEYPNRVFLGD